MKERLEMFQNEIFNICLDGERVTGHMQGVVTAMRGSRRSFDIGYRFRYKEKVRKALGKKLQTWRDCICTPDVFVCIRC